MNEPLSEREIEILWLVADGCTNGEITALRPMNSIINGRAQSYKRS